MESDPVSIYKGAHEADAAQIFQVLAALDQKSGEFRPEHRTYFEGLFLEAMRRSGSKEKLSKEEAKDVIERALRESKDSVPRSIVERVAQTLGLR